MSLNSGTLLNQSESFDGSHDSLNDNLTVGMFDFIIIYVYMVLLHLFIRLFNLH